MRFKLNILINLMIIFFSFEILEIKAHNIRNGGCKEYCLNIDKNKVFKNNKKLITEKNSCINNSLCRG